MAVGRLGAGEGGAGRGYRRGGNMSQLPLSYHNPVTAVFLRILAWELYVAKRELKVQDVVTDQIQTARKELGLSPLEGGAAQDFIQKLRLGSQPFLTPKYTPPAPAEPDWPTEWRLLYLPSHGLVRQLSGKPVVTLLPASETHKEFQIALRHPALPTLQVFMGANVPRGYVFGNRRGVYFLWLANSLYIGKSDEFDVRLSQHSKLKNLKRWVFVSPDASGQTFTQDALGAAESLLISFWNEVADVDNQRRGSDKKPAFAYLQEAVLLVEAASAALLWLTRENKKSGLPDWSIPFKRWKGRGWPECYERVPD